MIRKLILLLLICASATVTYSQSQKGIVKTRGKMINGTHVPGQGLPGTVVAVRNKGNFLIQKKDGSFSFSVYEGGYVLDSVKKQGYVLLDADIISKTYSYSENPLCLVMETPDQILQDKVMAMKKINNTLSSRLAIKEAELDSLVAQSKITMQEYNQALEKLYSEREKNTSLVSEMAENFSQIDYDFLDDFTRKVSDLILNGDLERADSLLNSRGNINSDVENLMQLREANEKEHENLKREETRLRKRKADHKKSLELERVQMEDLAYRCYNKFKIFKLSHNNDSAMYYLECRVQLDTANIDWNMAAGEFMYTYMSNYGKAVDYYERAIRHAVKQGDSSAIALCYNNIAKICLDVEKFDLAIEYVTKGLELNNAEYGYKSSGVAASHSILGGVYYAQGKFDIALEEYKKALDINISMKGECNEYTAVTYNNIGLVYRALGNISGALEFYKKSLEVYNGIPELDQVELVGVYNNLANLYTDAGDFRNAVKYHEKSLEIRLDVFGERNLQAALGYNNMGVLKYNMDDIDGAIDMWNKALAIYITIFGEQTNYVATIYNNLASSSMSKGMADKALEYNRKAIEIQIKVHGKIHPEVATCYVNGGYIYSEIGEYAKALAFHGQALEIYKQLYGLNHPDIATCFNNMAFAYSKQGRLNEALENYQKALEIRIAKYGETNPGVANTYHNMGMLCKKSNDYDGAKRNLNKAIEIYAKIYGEDNYRTVNARGEYMLIDLTRALNGTRREFEKYMEDKVYNLIVGPKEGPAGQQGMEGEYYILEYDDWNYNMQKSMFEKNEQMRGKPKTLTVYKDGIISQYHFENSMGVQLFMKVIDKKGKDKINLLYKSWKRK